MTYVRIEISSLFHLLSVNGAPVTKALIGSGVYLEKLNRDWIGAVREQCSKVRAREELEVQKTYTHRFFYELQDSNASYDVTNPQPILRAISLSRIVKPTSIPYSNVWVRSVTTSSGVQHFSEPVINGYSVAFGLREHEWNTITEVDVSEMSRLWGSLSHFIDDRFELTYRRIVRAIKYFELAHAIYFANLRYPVIHAALESMICTTHQHNKAQVTQRLPQIASFVSKKQAEDIYSLCCDFKHAAQALLTKSTEMGVIDPGDQTRIEAVSLLHEAVRHLLLRSLSERAFADTLVDVTKLRQTYQAFDSKGNLI
jgi:hypothetical protein